MTKSSEEPERHHGSDLLRSLNRLACTVLGRARGGISRIEMLKCISEIVIDSSPTAFSEWWLKEGKGYFRCAITRAASGGVRWEVDNLDVTHPSSGVVVGTKQAQTLSRTYLDFVSSNAERGSLWLCDSCRDDSCRPVGGERASGRSPKGGTEDGCLVLIPLSGDGVHLGFVSFSSSRGAHFSRRDVEFLELVAEIVAVGLVHQEAQAKLHERVKELHCLYSVAHLSDNPERPLDQVLQGVADLLPEAWQYPEMAAGRVVLDGREFRSPGFSESSLMQSAPLVIGGTARGSVDVAYLGEHPRHHGELFLEEEQNLIDAVTREVAGIVERQQVRDEKARLENQLRHADRLATIGQLAAGVAHELNEPLGGILGFAQLAEKADGVPPTVRRDLGKIVEACLYSRRVVSKLKLFARQMPTQNAEVDLNRMISEEFFIIESRCAKQGVRIVEDLDPGLPRILGDPGQIYQVLVNLAVNAVQAMPDGGRLTISTRRDDGRVVIEVADTGVGMPPEVVDRIFLPFFTTKSAEEGTGLGLSVVHGIVSAHGGEIRVESASGRGARFEVSLPIGGPATKGES